MKVKIGIADGIGGYTLHIKDDNAWWLIAGKPYKNKQTEFIQTLELDVPFMLMRIAHLMRDKDEQMELF